MEEQWNLRALNVYRECETSLKRRIVAVAVCGMAYSRS